MRVSSNDSFDRIFRKKLRGVNAMVQPEPLLVLQPPPGQQFMLQAGFIKSRVGGVATDAPSINLTTTGTGGGTLVAAVDAPITEGPVKRLTVTGDFVIDYEHPLTLTLLDAADNTTPANLVNFGIDVILVLVEISS